MASRGPGAAGSLTNERGAVVLRGEVLRSEKDLDPRNRRGPTTDQGGLKDRTAATREAQEAPESGMTVHRRLVMAWGRVPSGVVAGRGSNATTASRQSRGMLVARMAIDLPRGRRQRRPRANRSPAKLTSSSVYVLRSLTSTSAVVLSDVASR